MCITIYYKSDFGLMAVVPCLPEVTEGRRLPPRSPPFVSALPGVIAVRKPGMKAMGSRGSFLE